MNLVSVEFPELYARHLCRHSQFGINVVHVAAVFGTWFALYGIAYGLLSWLSAPNWALAALAGLYLAAIAVNVPFRVFVPTALFIGLLLTATYALPALPIWAYLLMIPAWYKIQALSHKVWNIERDMTAFSEKYRKGPALFVMLTLYEAPILLNYLIFGRKDWVK